MMENRRIPLIIGLLLGVMALVGLIFFMVPVTSTSTMAVEPGAAPTTTVSTMPSVAMIILLIIVLLGVVMGVTAYLGRTHRREEKLKRDQDMFSVIDDLVLDLTPDEIDYLRGQLHAAGDGRVEESMQSLLAQRSHDRRAGLRE